MVEQGHGNEEADARLLWLLLEGTKILGWGGGVIMECAPSHILNSSKIIFFTHYIIWVYTILYGFM